MSQDNYRKKPVVIQAVQFTEALRNAIVLDRAPAPAGVLAGGADYHPGRRTVSRADFYIDTLEGRMRVELDDWIITGIKGEHYPCKPDIFALTYEPAAAPAVAEQEPALFVNRKQLEGATDNFPAMGYSTPGDGFDVPLYATPSAQKVAAAQEPEADELHIALQAFEKLRDALLPSFEYVGVSLRVSQEDHAAIRSALAGASTGITLLKRHMQAAPQDDSKAPAVPLSDLIKRFCGTDDHMSLKDCIVVLKAADIVANAEATATVQQAPEGAKP